MPFDFYCPFIYYAFILDITDSGDTSYMDAPLSASSVEALHQLILGTPLEVEDFDWSLSPVLGIPSAESAMIAVAPFTPEGKKYIFCTPFLYHIVHW